MNSVPNVIGLVGALVHHAVDPMARRRHEAFILHRLAVSFLGLAVAPFFLAFRGVPAPAESLAFAFVLVPLAAAVLVSRTGRLATGHAVMALGLVGFACLLATQASGLAAALPWLVLAQWEAALSRTRHVRAAVLVSAALLAIVLAAQGGDVTASLMGLLVIAYGATLVPAFGDAADDAAVRGAATAFQREALVEAMGGLVATLDVHGLVGDVEGDTRAVVGVDPPELRGRGLFQLVHVADRPLFLTLVADAIGAAETKSATVRLRVVQNDRAPHPPTFISAEIRVKSLGASATEDRAAIAVLRDVSASLRHEAHAAESARQSATALRSRDDFLASMSHELRTPLNAIIGFSEILGSRTLRPADADKQREYACIINQSGQHLLSVVNSILDMSKLQSGTFTILPEPFDLGPLVDQCCDMVRLKANEGRVTVVRDCPDGLDDIVGDKRAFKQILLNLMSNAVKFTPEHGTVRVAVRPEGTHLLLIVSDTGIGIGAADLAHLGDPFFQARASLDRPFEGTGLGLSVVRGLVGLHGGTMSIESEPGKGTRVTVRLPRDCQTTARPGASASIETIPRRPAPEPAHRPRESRIKAIA